MAIASRYTVALHILTLLAYSSEHKNNKYLTSDIIAKSVNTNPVYIRRILSSLSSSSLVQVRYGTGSGWCLGKTTTEITFLDVYEAVEQKKLFEYHRSNPNEACPIGENIQLSLEPYYAGAEQAMKTYLSRSTIADLLIDTVSMSNLRMNERLHSGVNP
ncbi:Rrf2 family transcriptional regulator [Paenibacillus polymyxa]|uniref:Rrf2 family transcriptional regulator n=1 Tax=Paenibacillus polymyxa TaxID=1406 RepID=UPI0004702E6A|nr:Rrf2 family transcriptional regulator [Paenibacillus polymyxa]